MIRIGTSVFWLFSLLHRNIDYLRMSLFTFIHWNKESTLVKHHQVKPKLKNYLPNSFLNRFLLIVFAFDLTQLFSQLFWIISPTDKNGTQQYSFNGRYLFITWGRVMHLWNAHQLSMNLITPSHLHMCIPNSLYIQIHISNTNARHNLNSLSKHQHLWLH